MHGERVQTEGGPGRAEGEVLGRRAGSVNREGMASARTWVTEVLREAGKA